MIKVGSYLVSLKTRYYHWVQLEMDYLIYLEIELTAVSFT